MSIFITSGYLLQSVTEEKENRVVEILLSSVPPLPLMTGKILGLGAAGLTQVAIWVATALIALPLLGQRFPDFAAFEIRPPVLGLALLFFVLGYLTYGAIFAAIGALAPGAREAQQYSGFFGFFAVIPLIFAGVFLTDPTSPIVIALALFPLTAPAAMLQILALSYEPPWPLVVASLGSLSIFAVLAAIAAARIFRATLLLYGARPACAAWSARSPPAAERRVPGDRSIPVQAVGFHSSMVWRAESLSLNQRASSSVYCRPLGGHCVLGEDGIDRALGLARAAVDALVRVDVELAVDSPIEVDAVDRADRHAGLVEDVDAGLGDDVGHSGLLGSGHGALGDDRCLHLSAWRRAWPLGPRPTRYDRPCPARHAPAGGT
jgi:hypothetical protein